MDTCHPALKLLIVVWGLFFFLHRSSAQSHYEAATYLSPDGTQIEVHNVSGCYPDYFPSDLVCDGAGFFTPVRNIFIFHLPDISIQTSNQTCVRDSHDCWYEDTPGKDLINFFLLCQHTQRCTGYRFGRTYVTRDIQLDCYGFENRQNNIYSYFQVFEYMCIPDDWVVDMTAENSKTGAAVFLRKNYRFQVDNSQGYNISCTMTAIDAGATIVIRSIDLRLCIGNIKCDQVLRISDGTTRPFILNTYDEDQERWLGSPVIFESEDSTVTLTIDSGLGQVFSAWLYVSPSSGEVTVTCERPIYFTTTTTSSTTTGLRLEYLPLARKRRKPEAPPTLSQATSHLLQRTSNDEYIYSLEDDIRQPTIVHGVLVIDLQLVWRWS